MNGERGPGFGVGFLMGIIVGGVVALLYAPKSGQETRAFIREQVASAKDTLGDKVAGVRRTMGEKISGEEGSSTGSAKQR